MALPLRRLLSKLEMPGTDWVLSRFGGVDEDPAPDSQPPSSSVVWLFGKWVEQGPDESSPPQSGERPSRNAAVADSAERPDRPEKHGER